MLRDIKIGMGPDMIDSGGFNLTWHGFFAFLGVVVAIWIIRRIAMQQKVKVEMVENVALWAVIGGVVGARIVHVADHWGFYSNNPDEIIAIWNGGIGLWGAILGGFLAGVAAAYLQVYPIPRLMDLAPVGMLVGQAVGRIGDIINGEHFSKATSLPWGVVYTHSENPSVLQGITVPQHPVVAYELLFDLALAWVMYRLLGRLKPDGMLFVAYVASYGLWRFFIQFFRTDDVKFASLQEAHIIALLVLAVTVPLLVYKARWVKAPPPPSAKKPQLQAKKG
jgi:phosphatidylglycerol:prolipoprotein diacylglycerol transferase